MTKYLMDEYEDASPQQYAIGMKVDESYPGVYEWHRVGNDNKILPFTKWMPSKTLSDVSYKYFRLTAAPTGKSCVAMSAGLTDPNNGRLVFTETSLSHFIVI